MALAPCSSRIVAACVLASCSLTVVAPARAETPTAPIGGRVHSVSDSARDDPAVRQVDQGDKARDLPDPQCFVALCVDLHVLPLEQVAGREGYPGAV
jgi:hypothetical protein